jgi:hypothetical protein
MMNLLTSSFVLLSILVVKTPNATLWHSIDFGQIVESWELVFIAHGATSDTLRSRRKRILRGFEYASHCLSMLKVLEMVKAAYVQLQKASYSNRL